MPDVGSNTNGAVTMPTVRIPNSCATCPQNVGIFVDAFTNNVTKDLVDVLQGIVILFVAAEALFRGPFAKYGWLKRTKL